MSRQTVGSNDPRLVRHMAGPTTSGTQYLRMAVPPIGWRSRLSIGCVWLAAIASCSTREAPAARAVAGNDEPAWRAKLDAARAAKDRELKTSTTSLFAAAERFTPTRTSYLVIEDGPPRLEDQPVPAAIASFEPDGSGRWTWKSLQAGVSATTREGTPVTPGPISASPLFRLTPRFLVRAQIAIGELVLTVFDAQRPEFVQFDKLAYFAPEPRFVVDATLERVVPPVTVSLATSLGLQKPYVRYATLRFTLDGKPYALSAFRLQGSQGRELFVPFRDATSGTTSYPAARFLDLEEPADPAAHVTLDFNYAYNPYCAYSPAFNCTLPPPENDLKVAIAAGEQKYSH
jgi:uncharacterized protein (DUF1684 family)